MCITCPHCQFDLEESAELRIYGFVAASNDPDGKARLDLILRCEECESEWNAFVALEDFFENPVEKGCG